jgi:hypothetical protein
MDAHSTSAVKQNTRAPTATPPPPPPRLVDGGWRMADDVAFHRRMLWPPGWVRNFWVSLGVSCVGLAPFCPVARSASPSILSALTRGWNPSIQGCSGFRVARVRHATVKWLRAPWCVCCGLFASPRGIEACGNAEIQPPGPREGESWMAQTRVSLGAADKLTPPRGIHARQQKVTHVVPAEEEGGCGIGGIGWMCLKHPESGRL